MANEKFYVTQEGYNDLVNEHENLVHKVRDVVVGDLSANLINNINPLANLVRIPDKQTALMEDWSKKLPALVEASRRQNVTNISGVPSWFLSVIKEVMRREGVESIHDVWHNLEVFFHGGISFKPTAVNMRASPTRQRCTSWRPTTPPKDFSPCSRRPTLRQCSCCSTSGCSYEFIPLSDVDSDNPQTLTARDVEPGHTYELVITACNGLWRYRIGAPCAWSRPCR